MHNSIIFAKYSNVVFIGLLNCQTFGLIPLFIVILSYFVHLHTRYLHEVFEDMFVSTPNCRNLSYDMQTRLISEHVHVQKSQNANTQQLLYEFWIHCQEHPVKYQILWLHQYNLSENTWISLHTFYNIRIWEKYT